MILSFRTLLGYAFLNGGDCVILFTLDTDWKRYVPTFSIPERERRHEMIHERVTLFTSPKGRRL